MNKVKESCTQTSSSNVCLLQRNDFPPHVSHNLHTVPLRTLLSSQLQSTREYNIKLIYNDCEAISLSVESEHMCNSKNGCVYNSKEIVHDEIPNIDCEMKLQFSADRLVQLESTKIFTPFNYSVESKDITLSNANLTTLKLLTSPYSMFTEYDASSMQINIKRNLPLKYWNSNMWDEFLQDPVYIEELKNRRRYSKRLRKSE